MIYMLHYFKDPKLWQLWYVPYLCAGSEARRTFPKISCCVCAWVITPPEVYGTRPSCRSATGDNRGGTCRSKAQRTFCSAQLKGIRFRIPLSGPPGPQRDGELRVVLGKQLRVPALGENSPSDQGLLDVKSSHRKFPLPAVTQPVSVRFRARPPTSLEPRQSGTIATSYQNWFRLPWTMFLIQMGVMVYSLLCVMPVGYHQPQ